MKVGMNILVQNLPLFGGLPKHKLSRFVHNLLITYLLSESHAGLDLPWATHRTLPKPPVELCAVGWTFSGLFPKQPEL